MAQYINKHLNVVRNRNISFARTGKEHAALRVRNTEVSIIGIQYTSGRRVTLVGLHVHMCVYVCWLACGHML